ncbi:MAG: type 2 lanthipeptide synthetase LanM family protein [Candidatus Nanohaloarchaea archaeon]
MKGEMKRRLAWKAAPLENRVRALNKSSVDIKSINDLKGEELDKFNELKASGNIVSQLGDREDNGYVVKALKLDKWPDDVYLPEWAQIVEHFISVSRGDKEFDFSNKDVPFSQISRALAKEIVEEVVEIDGFDKFGDKVHSSMVSALLGEFTEVLAEALYVEFELYKEEKGSDNGYKKFVRDFVEKENIIEFLRTYPMVIFYIGKISLNWKRFIRQFHNRLVKDWEDIVAAFGVSPDSQIEEIEFSRGDTHDGGKSVSIVHTSSGDSFVYKPRSVSSLSFYYDIQKWASDKLDYSLPSIEVLEKEGYGWVDFVESKDCSSQDEVKSYYKKVGSIIAISSVLKATDLHFENVIAKGSAPLLIDVETILHPFNVQEVIKGVDSEAGKRNRVLRTELLPRDGDNVLGGIAGFEKPEIPIEKGYSDIKWKNVNETNMKIERVQEQVKGVNSSNLPCIGEDIFYPSEFYNEIILGYQATAQVIAINEDEFMDRFLDDADIRTRVVFRHTRAYKSLIKVLTQPDKLMDSVESTVSYRELSSKLSEDHHILRPDLLSYEVSSVMNLDVPRIEYRTSDGRIYIEKDRILTGLELDVIGEVKDYVKDMDIPEIEKNIEILELAFTGKTGVLDFIPKNDRGMSNNLAINNLIRDIYLKVTNLEVDGESLSWKYYIGEEGLDITSTKYGLHRGKEGIAVFYAYYYSLFGNETAKKKALSVWKENKRLSTDSQNLDLSLASGRAAQIYSGIILSQLLDEDLRDDLEELALSISNNQISDYDDYDLWTGLAGLTLSYLRLYEETDDPNFLRKAERSGDELVSFLREGQSEIFMEQLGFAHGSAGVVYVLAELYAKTGTMRYRRLANSMLEEIRDYFNYGRMNWPDLRKGKDEFMDAWCTGRSGILLAIFKSYQLLGRNQEVDYISIDSVGFEDKGLDILCHGKAGKIDLILHLYEKDLVEKRFLVQDLLNGLIQHKQKTGHYSLKAHGDQLHNPVFMEGLSGIGYMLCRVKDPELPSVLSISKKE